MIRNYIGITGIDNLENINQVITFINSNKLMKNLKKFKIMLGFLVSYKWKEFIERKIRYPAINELFSMLVNIPEGIFKTIRYKFILSTTR